MSALEQARKDVAAALESEGIKAHAHLPERLVPPAAVVQGGDPYLEADTYGSLLARHEVIVSTARASNEVGSDSLDALLEDALVGLLNHGYSVERVTAPYALEIGTATFPAVTLTATKPINL